MMIKDKEIDMKIITGLTRVRWSSAMGPLMGTVKRVDTAKNAAGNWIEWLVIGDMVHELNPKRFSEDYTTRIPTTAMKMLKMKVLPVA